MTKLFRATAAVLSTLAVGVLAGCGSDDTTTDTAPSGLQISSLETVMTALPSQDQILKKQQYAYLMAAPTVTKLDLGTDAANSHKGPSSLKDQATGGDAAIQEVNAKCAIYEQAAIGLISTPGAEWTITGGAHRNIIIGQSGVNQISGYASVLQANSTSAAAGLFNDFKSNATACNDALKALYPGVADKFTMQPPAVDASSGMVTLRGTYNGQPFNIAMSQEDKYVFTTWFTTTGTGGEDTISSATQTVQSLTLENVSNL